MERLLLQDYLKNHHSSTPEFHYKPELHDSSIPSTLRNRKEKHSFMSEIFGFDNRTNMSANCQAISEAGRARYS